MAAAAGGADRDKIVTAAAAQVVGQMADITPPAQGGANSEARARGEASILGDVFKLFAVSAESRVGRRREALVSYAEAKAYHARMRSKGTGRVNSRGRKEMLLMSQADMGKLLAELYKHIGTLISGWWASAQTLGGRGRFPAWARKAGAGSCTITRDIGSIKIRIANEVRFVDRVKDLRRRLQWSLDTVAKSIIERQIPAMIARRARRAGFRAR